MLLFLHVFFFFFACVLYDCKFHLAKDCLFYTEFKYPINKTDHNSCGLLIPSIFIHIDVGVLSKNYEEYSVFFFVCLHAKVIFGKVNFATHLSQYL